MSRIQKRRQASGAKDTTTGDRNQEIVGLERSEETSRESRGQIIPGNEGGEIEEGRSLRGRDRRRNNIEDEKPKSDDEDDNKNEQGRLKLQIDPPADPKTMKADDIPSSKGPGRPPRADKDKVANPIHENNDTEARKDVAEGNQIEKDLEKGPLKILQPLRTDPLAVMKSRHKKLERLNAESVPEIHFIGKILSGDNIVKDKSEGGSCRWKVETTPCWIHLGGELQGQSHVVYARTDSPESSLVLPFDHPLDLHFAESGIPGWGAPRLCVQTYRLDVHGRRILGGYGFTHLPTTQGIHTLEISLWRPVGTTSEEMESYLLGRVPALLTSDPIYETAWQDRERLMTTTAGTVLVEIFVLTRFMYKQNIDSS